MFPFDARLLARGGHGSQASVISGFSVFPVGGE